VQPIRTSPHVAARRRGRTPPARGQNERVSLEAAEKFFGLLAIVAGIGAIVLLITRLVPAARRLTSELYPITIWLAWLVAAVSMFGSLYFSESKGLEPCHLCWYQRIAMYSLAVVLLVGAIRRDHHVRWYAVPLAAIGLVISIYHRLIEAHPSWEGSGVCSVAQPCSSPYFHVYDIFTLAMMAMCGFAAILALLLLVPRPPELDIDAVDAVDADGELVSR